MFEKPFARIFLPAAAVAGFGFLLLTITFLVDYLLQTSIDAIVRLFTAADMNMSTRWYPSAKHAAFVVVIGLTSWAVFRSKLGVLYKAMYMTVPLAVVFVSIGIFLFRWPVVPFAVGFLITIGVLFYFHRTRQPWLYYYTVILVALSLAVFTLLGGDI